MAEYDDSFGGDIDFFGYNRAKVGTYIYSSDYAALYFSNDPGGTSMPAIKAGLVQNAALAYQHNVQPRFEAGSHELYWLTGQSVGTLQMGRLVSDRGMLADIQHGGSPTDVRKGVLGTVEFKMGRIGMEGIAVKQDVLMLNGCVLSSYGVAFNVGGLEVQESLTIQTALVRKVRRA